MADAVPLETILVADDDALVLRLVANILERHNYRVLRAANADEALRIEAEYSGAIHLLLTDIAMPAMSGPQLANQFLEHRPETRVMLMSGYNDGPVLLLNHGWTLLRKPFFKETLLEWVHETLHGQSRSQGTDHFDTRR